MDFSKSFSEFSSQLTKSLIEENDKNNISYSPASIYFSLAILNVGSQKITNQEITNLLGLDFSILSNRKSENSQEALKIENLISKIISDIEKSSDLNTKIYTTESIKKDYLETIQTVFKSLAETVSFDDPEKAGNLINEWIKQKTNGRIENLIDHSKINQNTKLILINSIYFKGEWEIKFDERATNYRLFYLENGKNIDVKMMYRKYRAEIYENEEYTSLIRNFKNSNMTGIFILPSKNVPLTEFILSFKVFYLLID